MTHFTELYIIRLILCLDHESEGYLTVTHFEKL